jgi:hypothetical protein
MNIKSRLQKLESESPAVKAVYLWLSPKAGESNEQAKARLLEERGLPLGASVKWLSWMKPEGAAA